MTHGNRKRTDKEYMERAKMSKLIKTRYPPGVLIFEAKWLSKKIYVNCQYVSHDVLSKR